MAKLKTHKGTAKRFKLTATEKVMTPKQRRYHFRLRRAKRNKSQADKMHELNPSLGRHIKKLLPNGLD